MDENSPPPRRRSWIWIHWLNEALIGASQIIFFVFSAIVDSIPPTLLASLHGRSAGQHLADAISQTVGVFRAACQTLRRVGEGLVESPHPNVVVFFIHCVGFLFCLFTTFFFGLFLLLLAAGAVAVASPIALFVDVVLAITEDSRQSTRPSPQRAINQENNDDDYFGNLFDDPDYEEEALNHPDYNEDSRGDKRSGGILLLVVIIILAICPSKGKKIGDRCHSDSDCASGLCYNWNSFGGRKKCVQTTVTNPFTTVDTSLPFNKYAFLTTHNSFSITRVTRFTFYNQEDQVIDQLNNGVRALMLDVYDFRDDIWLCHWRGACYDHSAFEPAIYTLKEIEAFLLMNPSEIVTLILEDYVTSQDGLTKLFNETGLRKYWFPVKDMPRNGEDWPTVSDMIKNNYRFLVFTSNKSKELNEGIAYQWNYMVENQYGDAGMDPSACKNRSESPFLNDRTRSLVFVNYFRTLALPWTASYEHSHGLIDVIRTCHIAAGHRWANFLAVDFYKKSDGGGVFQATDMLNGMLICGRNDVRACRKGILKPLLNDLLLKLGLTWKGSEKRYGEVALSKQDQSSGTVSTQEKLSLASKEDSKFISNEEADHVGPELQDYELHDEL